MQVWGYLRRRQEVQPLRFSTSLSVRNPCSQHCGRLSPEPKDQLRMKIQVKAECTKDVHWSKVIQYQVIMEPIACALLSFVPNHAKQRFQKTQPEERMQAIQAAWPFRQEFSLVSMCNKSGATKIRIKVQSRLGEGEITRTGYGILAWSGNYRKRQLNVRFEYENLVRTRATRERGRRVQQFAA